MRFLNRNREEVNPGAERTASRIAAQIIRWKICVAAKINRRVNRYTKAGQRKFLWLFCAVWIAVICFNFFHAQQTKTIGSVRPDYLPVHIGQPSGIPEPNKKPIPRTDSLNTKK
ncbi:hypothetical protein KXD93_30370 [Mucilaginibacter sp. BJC16-A38]|uniref:hypothetical protein n=1 Tax=Mucilaginibacter phenanthrenivorans TaxID=1234842 RepID=UPI002157B6AE|nr:hypothetical protein [Mucilaginibacter phenanthrenivorans]MCR8561999.1 hypothetical protein [Mucilaginibacter phenanthrenivorans]